MDDLRTKMNKQFDEATYIPEDDIFKLSSDMDGLVEEILSKLEVEKKSSKPQAYMINIEKGYFFLLGEDRDFMWRVQPIVSGKMLKQVVTNSFEAGQHLIAQTLVFAS